MKFKALIGGGFLGVSKEIEYDTFESAFQEAGENIKVEMTGREFLELQKHIKQMEQQIQSLNAVINECREQIQNARKEREAVWWQYTDLESKYRSLQEKNTTLHQEIDALRQQYKSYEQLQNDLIETRKKLAYWEQKDPSKEIGKVKINPYAYGVAIKKGKPSPKVPVQHSKRSLQLLSHLESCPVLIRLAVERLLGCHRKAAVAAIEKLYQAGYLEYVTFVGGDGAAAIKVYYAPTKIQGPVKPNQACQGAVLSLLYAVLFRKNDFQNLHFRLRNCNLSRKEPDNWYYAADISFNHIRRLNGKETETKINLFTVPVREQQNDKSISFYQEQSGNADILLIHPLIKEEAEKRTNGGLLYMTDESLLKNNLEIYKSHRLTTP